jgi:hypothetical protein
MCCAHGVSPAGAKAAVKALATTLGTMRAPEVLASVCAELMGALRSGNLLHNHRQLLAVSSMNARGRECCAFDKGVCEIIFYCSVISIFSCAATATITCHAVCAFFSICAGHEGPFNGGQAPARHLCHVCGGVC